MLTDNTEDIPPDECNSYIMAFLADRDLIPIKQLDKDPRAEHDKQYQKFVEKEGNNRKNRSGMPKKYREEIYNKNSNCDAQFINNLHHYKTIDGGSGHRVEQKHYAMDFIAENPCGPSDREKLKNLKIFSKNQMINDWLNRQNPPTRPIRRTLSCIDLSLESLKFDKNREKRARERKTTANAKSDISNIDPSFLPENLLEMDASKLLNNLSTALKFLCGKVNTQNLKSGEELKIQRVICSTDDFYAYVIPEEFDIRGNLLNFSADFQQFFSSLSEENRAAFGINGKFQNTYFSWVNVVLFLEEFIEDKTCYRRARHVCQLPSERDEDRKDLFLEIDTGMLRVVVVRPETCRMLPQKWASRTMPILEVRFLGADTAEKVTAHIECIRQTCRAFIRSIDRLDRAKYARHAYYYKSWSTLDTAVLQTYKPKPTATLDLLFCEDRDCMGMCNIDGFWKRTDPIAEVPPAVEKLKMLRERFKYVHNLAAYIVPYTDAHQNEQIPEHYARLKFLSEFSGTYGTAVVSKEKAVLWTDNCHYKIGCRELNKEAWVVKNKDDRSTEKIGDWLAQELKRGDYVGFDPTLLTYSFYITTTTQLQPYGIELVPIAENLIDTFWTDRPYREGDAVKIQSLQTSGKSPSRKLSSLREELSAQRCTAAMICSLEDVMWLLNLRGNDLPFSPLTYSYLFVTQHDAHLFIDLVKLDKEAQAHLNRFDVKFHAYRKVYEFVWCWLEAAKNAYNPPMVHLGQETNQWIGSVFGEYSRIANSIVKEIKSKKNRIEMNGMRASNLRDSVAIVEFLSWLDREMLDLKRQYTEVDMVQKLEQFKRNQKTYEGLSCPTLFSSGENSSSAVHDPDPNRIISELGECHLHQFLFQSGGHYVNGTSSVSRTFCNTDPTEEFALNYTAVLRGHINVASAHVPPHSTFGSRLDVFAKKELWNVGLDNSQATGHGVGHCLNIRDTQVIGEPESSADSNGLVVAEQVISLEPAYYDAGGKYGIRIGNCYETVPVERGTDKDPFVAFKPLTLVPIQTSFLVKKLLQPEDVLWINRYHHRVLLEVGRILLNEGKLEAWEWLGKACEPI
ncbi:hypothetical protein L3Y34_006759 [Caenorhabditis briggsae]|uniref:Uncharacterized protein n=1 Tax=Caenorhabditis briggsae TaxID=6238 RepID=A0AAE8ZV26_CAEBR|nr:hypothetical protein L3Y34_006759 [Caenorhabditis briggsae]